MSGQITEAPKKKICTGLMAHVDAGKTTLSEALLYRSGTIRALGRVDRRDSFLDNAGPERQRGITVFAKQANFTVGDTLFQLLDTPGHLDFGGEAERALQVLDYAVLVVSGPDGVQPHTRTLWQLLGARRIPVFVFVNKMDLPGADKEAVLADLQRELSPACVDFTAGPALAEQLALCTEALMERFLANEAFTEDEIAGAIARREVFPCWFGSALRLEGVDDFLDGLQRYTRQPAAPAPFGALVYKISRDPQGARLTWMKITGGALAAKSVVQGRSPEPWAEKADQIRVYSGAKFTPVRQAEAGMVVAVTGLNHTRPGCGLGTQPDAPPPVLTPVLHYRLLLPEGSDPQVVFQRLRQLEEEDPLLRLSWEARSGSISAELMGQVQLEILAGMIAERFGLEVGFGPGEILYRETIAAPAEGIGHFEPLRHYAEVHLLLEPLPRGSGLQFAADISTDRLDENWQRLIYTHLTEQPHPGVLTGSPITDMRISLLAGKAHLKHTEGGDFRQATCRAVRNGLMQTQSLLLEPWYEYTLTLPETQTGRAINDLQQMGATFSLAQEQAGLAVLRGRCPVATMQTYSAAVAAYTGGQGQLQCAVCGYDVCHNAEEIIASAAYDPTADPDHSPDSVFCSHGAGHIVPWNEVAAHAHLPPLRTRQAPPEPQPQRIRAAGGASDAELQAVFDNANYRRKAETVLPSLHAGDARQELEEIAWHPPEGDYLLVDGYNILFAWNDLKRLARVNLPGARDALIDLLQNYQGYKQITVILVFDAYRVPGGSGSVERHGGLYVVYTREAETADSYIERTTYRIAGRDRRVRVATSDSAEQAIILGNGALRMSAEMLRLELNAADGEIRRIIEMHNLKNEAEARSAARPRG